MVQPTGSDDGALGSDQLQDRAVKGAAWTMLHTVVSLPIAFLVNLLLARVLAPEGYGRLAFLTTLIAIVGGLIALGLSTAMIQFGSKAHAAGRTDEVRRILSASQGFRLLIVAPVLTLLVIVLVDVPVALLLLAVAFGVWVPALLDGAPITLFIENKTAVGARIAMASNLLVQVGVVVVVLWLGTADSVWAARTVLTAGGIGLALLAISPRYRSAVLRPRLPRGFPAGFWKFALPTGAAGMIGELALSRTEVLYLTWWSTAEAAGLYALAFGLAGHIFAPAHALTGPLLPAISGIHEVDPTRVVEAFARTVRASCTIISLLTATALPALVVLVPTLYGDAFAEAAPAVLVLGIVGALMVVTGPVSAFVLARLSSRVFLHAHTAALGVNLLAALVLIPTFGMWGAVIANAAAALTQLGVLLVSEQRDLQMSLVSLVTNMLPVFIGAVACSAGWAASRALSTHAIGEATVAALVAVLLLFLGLRAMNSGLDSGDASAILRVSPLRLQPLVGVLLSVITRR